MDDVNTFAEGFAADPSEKSVRTPTWPAGTETTEEKKEIRAKMAAARRRI